VATTRAADGLRAGDPDANVKVREGLED